MARKPETVFRARIRPSLEELPNTVLFGIQQVAIRGTPDFLLCIGGVFVALELKRDAKANVTALQKYNIDRIKKAGGIAFVTWPENWHNVYSILKQLAEKKHVQIEIR